MSMRERIARAIAGGIGDDYDHAFENKHEWNIERGMKGGRFRDINEPFQGDYDGAADAVLNVLMEPTDAMEDAGYDTTDGDGYGNITHMSVEEIWQAMIKAAKDGK